MATYNEMVTSVRNTLRDSEAVFITDTMIGEWINEAYRDIAARLGILRTNASGTTTVTGTIPLPADFVRILSLRIDDTTDTVPSLTPIWVPDDIYLSYVNSDTVPGDFIYRIYEGTVEIHPLLSLTDYVMEYVYRPADVAGGNEPSLDEELHPKLINYARAHAKYIEGEMNEGDRYWGMYMEGLPGASLGVKKERGGPLNMVPAPSYWDGE